MKNIQVLALAFLCSMSGTVSGAATKSDSARAPEYSVMQWLPKEKARVGVGVTLGTAGVGGLVGTGFVIKKIVRVAKEAIVLKKQLQANPKDMSLRKKRRVLIGKAIGLGIGGLVLGLLSVGAVGLSGRVAQIGRRDYLEEKRWRSPTAKGLVSPILQMPSIHEALASSDWKVVKSTSSFSVTNPVSGLTVPADGSIVLLRKNGDEMRLVYSDLTGKWHDVSNQSYGDITEDAPGAVLSEVELQKIGFAAPASNV
jgi:hypothetical protein